ncbi:MAG: chromate transporter [Oscillospiraceae bacterium]|nr:chromate transporter [Oscillospiraceae bacterium]
MKSKNTLQAKNYLRVFWVMFKIGMFTFGGGLAMLPQMSAELTEKNKLMKQEELTDAFAVAQSLPGVVAVNASMLAGYKLGGLPCAIVAAMGSALPSFLILIFVTIGYQAFIINPNIAGAMVGIRAAVAGTLAATVFKLGRTSLKGVWGWSLCAAALICAFLSVNAVYIIIGGLAAGIVNYFIEKNNAGRGDPGEL